MQRTPNLVSKADLQSSMLTQHIFYLYRWQKDGFGSLPEGFLLKVGDLSRVADQSSAAPIHVSPQQSTRSANACCQSGIEYGRLWDLEAGSWVVCIVLLEQYLWVALQKLDSLQRAQTAHGFPENVAILSAALLDMLARHRWWNITRYWASRKQRDSYGRN